MTKKIFDKSNKRRQGMKFGDGNNKGDNIYAFNRDTSDRPRSEEESSPWPDAEHRRIIEMIESLEVAIKEIEPAVDELGCEYAKILLRMYKWAHAEFSKIVESTAPPDAERIKSLCALLQIESREL